MARKPAFGFLSLLAIGPGGDGVPQSHQTRAFVADMLAVGPVEPQSGMADRFERIVHEGQHRRAGPIGAFEIVALEPPHLRRAAHFAGRIGRSVHLPREEIAGLPEIARAGPLEAEDRLFVIADRENGPHRIAARAQPVEEIVGQSLHDAPLGFVGVLRLVHQDVVETAVELVADPVRHRAVGQKLRGAGDEIVEINQSLARLRLFPAQSEGPSRFELRGEKFRQIDQRAPFVHLPYRLGDDFLMLDEGWIALFRARHLARRPILFQKRVEEPVQRFQPRLLVTAQPCLGEIGGILARRCFPFAGGSGAGAHRLNREIGVRTRLFHPGLIGVRRDPEQAVDARFHRRLPPVGTGPKMLVPGTTHQPAAHRIGALAAAHLGNRRIDSGIAFRQHRGQNLAAQQVALAIFHRARTGEDFRFGRKGGKQILSEGVDRIDPQATARTIEHSREQRTGARACFGIGGRAEIA